MRYRQYIEGKKFPATAPKRIIFYRGLLYFPPTSYLNLSAITDGVSEGQFKQVLEQGATIYSNKLTIALTTTTELPALKSS